MEKAQLCSTTKGQRAIIFNNFMYREERTSQFLERVTWRCPLKSCNKIESTLTFIVEFLKIKFSQNFD